MSASEIITLALAFSVIVIAFTSTNAVMHYRVRTLESDYRALRKSVRNIERVVIQIAVRQGIKVEDDQ